MTFPHKNFSWSLSSEEVLKSLINLNQSTFEVTNRCNLNCDYCAYGNLSEGFDKTTRNPQNLSYKIAIKIIVLGADDITEPLIFAEINVNSKPGAEGERSLNYAEAPRDCKVFKINSKPGV